MNIAVRTVIGTDGQTVILAAFCPTCNDEAMPMNDGTCGWCDTPIIGPPGSKAVKPPRANRKIRPRITHADIYTALQTEAARIGRNPYPREWQERQLRPSSKTIFRRFGSWAAALEAAGL